MTDRYLAGKRLWTESDVATLRQLYPDQPTNEIARHLRRSLSSVYQRAQKLRLHKSAAYLAGVWACRLRRGDGLGVTTQFKPGNVPANKGLRRPGWAPGRMRDHQFRTGERHGIAVQVYKPIGTVRLSKEGYLQRKVNDDRPSQKRWRFEHLIVWEAAHGPVPPDHAVVFRNGDKADIRLDNLELITRADLMARNSVHNLPKPLALTVQMLGALNRQIRKRTSHAQEEQDRRSAGSPVRDARSPAR